MSNEEGRMELHEAMNSLIGIPDDEFAIILDEVEALNPGTKAMLIKKLEEARQIQEDKAWNHMDELLLRATEFLAARFRVRGHDPHEEQAAVDRLDRAVHAAHVAEGVAKPGEHPRRPMTMAELEETALRDALKYANGNLQLAAKNLEISRGTLYRKVKQYKILE